MRLSLTIAGLLACLITLVAAWSKEDQEIFRLRDEVELSEGAGVTFYDFLDITPSASQDEINKAYRKKSRVLHPDKVKRQFSDDKKKDKKGASKIPSKSEIKSAGKAASDRFARLGIVTEILRGPGRERYDHFLRNGFPTWRGTGYYYARFRPGLGSVLVFLFVFVGGGGHWVMLFTSWKQQRKFVQKYISDARKIAFKDGMGIPIPGLDAPGSGANTLAADESDAPQQQIPRNRRERRMADKMEAKDTKKEKKPRAAKASPAATSSTPPTGAVGPRKKVVAENGKVLIVDSIGNVYLEQRDEEGEAHEYLLDVNEIPRPTIKSTALYRIPVWTINTVISRLTGTSTQKPSENTDGDGDLDHDNIETPEVEDEAATGSSDGFEHIKKDKAKTSAVNGKGVANKKAKKRK